jgi:hypothetical protein
MRANAVLFAAGLGGPRCHFCAFVCFLFSVSVFVSVNQ